MLDKSVLVYVLALYGGFVGAFFPLIYLDARLYFRKRGFGFRNFFKYVGRFSIILILFSVIISVLFVVIEEFGSSDSLQPLFESNWYIVGFSVGFVGAIILCKVGLKRGRKDLQNKVSKE